MTAAAAPGPARRKAGLARNTSGISVVEFALTLPLLAGFMLGGIEMARYVLAANTAQRLASMSADLLAQSGVGGISTTEAQIYDLFYALDTSAKPFDMRQDGRVVLSVIKGVRQADNSVRNEYADASFSQQFDGGYTAAVPLMGCRTTTPLPTFRRVLPVNEILVHAQVTLRYRPLVGGGSLSLFAPEQAITRQATFRVRKNKWNITDDGTHPSKANCATATGL